MIGQIWRLLNLWILTVGFLSLTGCWYPQRAADLEKLRAEDALLSEELRENESARSIIDEQKQRKARLERELVELQKSQATKPKR